jgi:hypothetical protein
VSPNWREAGVSRDDEKEACVVMRRVFLALVVVGVAAIPAASAQAYQGACETQRALFEKYNIQIDMNAPLVAYVYNEACSHTG